MALKRRSFFLAVVGLLAGTAVNLAAALCAQAATFTVRGIDFSDEIGGFRLRGVTGNGTKDDPFIIVEEISEPGTAILTIRGLGGLTREGFKTPALGIHVRKIVLNGTGLAWRQFDLELRETLGQPSTYEDGLSFDQAQVAERPFISDRFLFSNEMHEPYDGVRFSGGVVPSGVSVSMSVTITDPTPSPVFYLLQTVSGPVAALPDTGAVETAQFIPRPDVQVPSDSHLLTH